jgi:hypothetical protein
VRDTFIFQGDAPPTTYESDMVGFQYYDNRTRSIASGPTYTLTGYNGKAGTYPVTASGITFVAPVSYNVIYEPGTLYVNPKGRGARKIKPFLVCVSYQPDHPSNFDYVAQFGYTNDNSQDLFLELGTDYNTITAATGSYNDTEVPDLFLRGTHYFDVPFDGTKLVWTVTSFEVNQKAAVASEASSTSSRCPTTTTTATTGARSVGVQESSNGLVGTERLTIYPNPATSKVTLDIATGELSTQALQAFDAAGRRHAIKGIRRLSAHSLELDIAAWPRGTYFIRAQAGTGYKIFSVVKSGPR